MDFVRNVYVRVFMFVWELSNDLVSYCVGWFVLHSCSVLVIYVYMRSLNVFALEYKDKAGFLHIVILFVDDVGVMLIQISLIWVYYLVLVFMRMLLRPYSCHRLHYVTCFYIVTFRSHHFLFIVYILYFIYLELMLFCSTISIYNFPTPLQLQVHCEWAFNSIYRHTA